MSIYTIGDLHLSFNENKPMGIFGDNWEGHEEKIRNNWINTVTENDLVVLPGDFSWSTYLKNTYKDFMYLNTLPGKKILLKGNHDYWWTTVTSMKAFLKENNFENIDFVYNSAYKFENIIIAGTRGWSKKEEGDNEKLIKREVSRLEFSIIQAQKIIGNEKLQEDITAFEKGSDNNFEIVVFMHYPPITKESIHNKEMNEFIQIMKKYNIKRCYYAHLHGMAINDAIEGNYFGIDFKLVSADALNFELFRI